ncbi:MAG: urea carboxylase-associated family protein [Methylomicrobium sp.]|nr:urea carboxylase-associated family protein [Methylomicrobium sp.]
MTETTPFAIDSILHSKTLAGATSESLIVRRSNTLRLTDLEGCANCSVLLFNADNLVERYNMADTLKAQHTAHLTKGFVCYSDMGHILMSITEDTCGWHDPIGGVSDAALVAATYGVGRYQELRNYFYRNGRELFLIELGKWGLGIRDLVANINFFSKVTVDPSGCMNFYSEHSLPGGYVDLHAEMDTLVVLNTCPHPLDTHPEWRPKPVQLTLWRPNTVNNALCRDRCPENQRGYANNAIYHCQSAV